MSGSDRPSIRSEAKCPRIVIRELPSQTPSIRRLALTILSFIPVAAAAPAMAEPAVSLQDIIGASERLPEATIYVAREVITMDPARPRAEAVAVVQGRIAAVGSRADIEKLAETQDYRIDETFADKVVMAGFVEQHVHPVLASRR